MQLGFVIDHTRCIGCHACSIACKSENDVPLGSYRTWVKYTEEGEFPSVRRGYSVLRCNQCEEPPCVDICPTSALGKGFNGVVEIDPKSCIGCKSCMQACPYDALYINPESGLAEKCHFCAHRTEVGLAPACAVVCPTEAIIPGDFDDPDSYVSRFKNEHQLEVRKPEAGTKPNVFYREVTPAGIDPGLTNQSHGSIWSDSPTGDRAAAEAYRAAEAKASEQSSTRTVYDVPRKMIWGWKITGYLWTKSIASGVFPLALIAAWIGADSNTGDFVGATGLGAVFISLVFLALTGLLLVLDLKRPERFLYILLRPNWKSWLVRGSYIIGAFGGLLSLPVVFRMAGIGFGGMAASIFTVVCVLLGAATAGYTGFLFSQAKGRVLWMRRGMWAHLILQAAVAGSSCLLIAHTVGLTLSDKGYDFMRLALGVSLALHLAMTLLEGKLAPKNREAEYHRTARLITHGPYKVTHWGVGIVAGILLPVALLSSGPVAVAGVLALVGLWAEKDLLVRAGQALPIS